MNAILPASGPNARRTIQVRKRFGAADTELANTAPALNTESITRQLGNEKAAYDTEATRRSALTAYIAEQQAVGLDYDAAWAKAKVERAYIFARMPGDKRLGTENHGSVGTRP